MWPITPERKLVTRFAARVQRGASLVEGPACCKQTCCTSAGVLHHAAARRAATYTIGCPEVHRCDDRRASARDTFGWMLRSAAACVLSSHVSEMCSPSSLTFTPGLPGQLQRDQSTYLASWTNSWPGPVAILYATRFRLQYNPYVSLVCPTSPTRHMDVPFQSMAMYGGECVQ
jgi:hypothetical protein